MKTKREQTEQKHGEKGNALIYVLIAIVLFAALNFSLSGQSTSSNTKDLDDAHAELYADQLLAFASQAKTAIDQMIITGSSIDDLDFTLPSEAGFNTAPHIHKVFHPAGGGLSLANLPDDAKQEVSNVPVAGWYLGRFNNVEWTKSTAMDVILTAYQINKKICEAINKKVLGTPTIPAVTGEMRNYFLERAGNVDFEISDCADCEGFSSLCVRNSPTTTYSFYNIVAAR